MRFQADAVDRVIKNAIHVMENSRHQIFEICNGAVSEKQMLDNELQQISMDISETIDKVDELELEYKKARIRLIDVSRDFKRYSEADIREAYEEATRMQMEVHIYREKEANLKLRRDELQKRIRNVDRTLSRAEMLGSQINVVLEYLSGDLNVVPRLLETAKNRQLLGLKIILAQEEERKRVAREMHDGPAQSLANLILRTEIAERMLDKQEYEAVKEELVDLKRQVRVELAEVRKIIYNLRPMTLDDLGLVPAVRKYVQDFEEKTKIHTVLEIKGKERRMSIAMEVAVYRLLQEALTNVAKHSLATHVSLELSMQAHIIKMTIQDNGIGFDVNQIGKAVYANSRFGLIGMRERVELLDGRFEIKSEINEGTNISMTIPLDTELKEE